MIIYRLEDNDGNGAITRSIYDGGINEFEKLLIKFVKKVNKNKQLYPSWYNDYSYFLYSLFVNYCKNYYSGCLSIDDIKKWFKNFLIILLDNGYHIVQYEVPERFVYISNSKKQIVFEKSKATSKIILNNIL